MLKSSRRSTFVVKARAHFGPYLRQVRFGERVDAGEFLRPSGGPPMFAIAT